MGTKGIRRTFTLNYCPKSKQKKLHPSISTCAVDSQVSSQKRAVMSAKGMVRGEGEPLTHWIGACALQTTRALSYRNTGSSQHTFLQASPSGYLSVVKLFLGSVMMDIVTFQNNTFQFLRASLSWGLNGNFLQTLTQSEPWSPFSVTKGVEHAISMGER